MRYPQYTPPKISFEKSACPKCGERVWLIQIEPDKPNYDKRTYKCSACENVVVEIVKYR